MPLVCVCVYACLHSCGVPRVHVCVYTYTGAAVQHIVMNLCTRCKCLKHEIPMYKTLG